MKIVLATIEGFAQRLIPTLSFLNADVKVVVPYKPGNFPHYPVEDLVALCERDKYELIVETERDAAHDHIARMPGGLIVATWPWIMPKECYAGRPFAFNIHPGLFPGRNPWKDSAERGDLVQVVYAHDLTPQVDEGRVLGAVSDQVPHDMEPVWRRRYSAVLAGELLLTVLSLLEVEP